MQISNLLFTTVVMGLNYVQHNMLDALWRWSRVILAIRRQVKLSCDTYQHSQVSATDVKLREVVIQAAN